MYFKKLMILYLILISSTLSSSYCYNISNGSLQTLEDKKNILLEIHTLDGNVYVTRNFHVDNDTLYIRDYTPSVGKKGINIQLDAVRYVKACEYDTAAGRKSGLKFAFGIVSFFTIVFYFILVRGNANG